MGERYVALGDSYTIGEGVSLDGSWPNLLVARLRQEGLDIELVANPSVTGWTTAQLIEHELPVLEASDATFVTLLIGVNDWVQNVPADIFRERLGTILDRIQDAIPDPGRIVVITIPDFSVAPEAARYSRGRDISAGIAAFNAVIGDEAGFRGIPVADIFSLSQELRGDEYVAKDGLHPSGAAYARWLDLMYPVVHRILAGSVST